MLITAVSIADPQYLMTSNVFLPIQREIVFVFFLDSEIAPL